MLKKLSLGLLSAVLRMERRQAPQPNLSRIELDSLPFWEGLPSLGPDTDDIIRMIKRAYPVPVTSYNPYTLRRKLYESILRFRTGNGRPWLLDEKVVKFSKKPTVLSLAVP